MLTLFEEKKRKLNPLVPFSWHNYRSKVFWKAYEGTDFALPVYVVPKYVDCLYVEGHCDALTMAGGLVPHDERYGPCMHVAVNHS